MDDRRHPPYCLFALTGFLQPDRIHFEWNERRLDMRGDVGDLSDRGAVCEYIGSRTDLELYSWGSGFTCIVCGKAPVQLDGVCFWLYVRSRLHHKGTRDFCRCGGSHLSVIPSRMGLRRIDVLRNSWYRRLGNRLVPCFGRGSTISGACDGRAQCK